MGGIVDTPPVRRLVCVQSAACFGALGHPTSTFEHRDKLGCPCRARALSRISFYKFEALRPSHLTTTTTTTTATPSQQPRFSPRISFPRPTHLFHSNRFPPRSEQLLSCEPLLQYDCQPHCNRTQATQGSCDRCSYTHTA
ncbi:hypothetical protein BST61_g5125 [Cercospora zeina]